MKSNQRPKHARFIRWTHWLNAVLLFLMMWSGVLIYWAHDPFRIGWGTVTLVHFFPRSFYDFLGLGHRLAEGMSWHFFVMWLFTINGIIYVAYLCFSGEWREIVPRRKAFLQKTKSKLNSAQRVAYTLILLVGAGSVLSGIAIYKPIQVSSLTELLGGYEWARFHHFWFMMIFIGFVFIHVVQVIRAGWPTFTAMISGYEVRKGTDFEKFFQKKFRRSFISGGISAIAGYLLFDRIVTGAREKELPVLLRNVLEQNRVFWQRLSSSNRVAPEVRPVMDKEPRVNGRIGLESALPEWNLAIAHQLGETQEHVATLGMQDILKLPQLEYSFSFKCIEGWSENMTVRGARFSDFIKAHNLGINPDTKSLYSFVGLETPDGEYYVSIDMESMLHSQTLLCHQMNGKSLSPENGAPLRLIIPVKYGIKHIKCIGTILFSDSRPKDYWYEEGYDWYAGL